MRHGEIHRGGFQNEVIATQMKNDIGPGPDNWGTLWYRIVSDTVTPPGFE